MSDLAFSGYYHHFFPQENRKSPVKSRGFLLILFPAVFLLLLISGCAGPLGKSRKKVPSEKEPVIRVALSDNFQSGNLAFQGSYHLHLEEATYVLNEKTGAFRVSFRNKQLVLKSSERYFSLNGPQKIFLKPANSESFFKIDNILYSGELELLVKGDRLKLINILPLEKYLRGVVPAEIPAGEQDYWEAVRAQAVTARTYALFHLEHPAAADFDVFADTRDQVYEGEGRHRSLSDEAIAQTRGQTLTLNGRPVETLYHSTCGGILVEDGPGGTDGQPAAEYFRLDKTGDDYNCAVSPYFRWVEVRTVKDLLKRFSRWYKIPTINQNTWAQKGVQLQLRILERSASGRIRKMELSAGSYRRTISGFTIRRFLANSEGSPLPSTLFFMVRPTQKKGTLYLVGAGFGHGRGMCQWGALGMALHGKKYREILSFYYPKFQLTKLY